MGNGRGRMRDQESGISRGRNTPPLTARPLTARPSLDSISKNAPALTPRALAAPVRYLPPLAVPVGGPSPVASVMRTLLLLVVAASASAQPLDVLALGGVALSGPDEVLVSGVAPAAGAAVAVTPPVLGGRFRAVLAASVSPQGSAGLPDRTAAVGLSVEAPLSGGRNGVYLSLGGAYVDYDGPDRGNLADCEFSECPTHIYGPDGFRGLAWSGGVGARVPLAERVFASGEALAFFGNGGNALLPRLHLGVGYRLR